MDKSILLPKLLFEIPKFAFLGNDSFNCKLNPSERFVVVSCSSRVTVYLLYNFGSIEGFYVAQSYNLLHLNRDKS